MAALAAALAGLTILLLITRPKGLSEGIAAPLGAIAFLVAGLVSPGQAASAVVRDWNVFLFFLGLMVVAGLSESAGVFDWLASWAARHSFGSVRILFLFTVVLTSVVTLLLTNDTAALALTPIVYALVRGVGLEPLPFMFATSFLANAASPGMPMSNPINFLLADSFGISLPTYVRAMWLPAIASIAATALLLFFLYRRDIRGSIDTTAIEEPQMDRRLKVSAGMLVAVAIAFVVASSLQAPLGIVAVTGATALAIATATTGSLTARDIATTVSPAIFGFLAGMLVVIEGLRRVGAIAAMAHAMLQLGGTQARGIVAVTTVGSAVGSNIVNNLPAAVALDATLHGASHLSPAVASAGMYGTILGCDLGPNLTHLGSLSSMIWILILRRRGLDVSALDYVRTGVILMPAALAAAALALYFSVK